MQSFLGDSAVKEKYLKRVKAHAKADQIVKGRYWENGKGCAVGCTIHGDDHSKYEKLLGIPRSIAQLEDRIFEGLSNEDAMKFPVQFLEAVPVGADLSKVTDQFLYWLLKRTIKYTTKDSRQYNAVRDVINLYKLKIAGEVISSEKWQSARSAAAAAADAAYAAAAAAYAAYAAAAAAAAAYAAYAAAYAAYAAAAAAYAAYAAADADAAYARSTARAKSYKAQAKQLLKLLKQAK